jgi:hypothetical protein
MTRSTFRRFVTLTLAVPIAGLAWSAVARSQTPSARIPEGQTGGVPRTTSTYVPPRTPDGQPDISGMYEPGWIGQPTEIPTSGKTWHSESAPGGRSIGPTDFGAQQAAETDPTTSHIVHSNKPMIIDPPDSKIPMQPWVFEMRKKIYSDQHKAEYLDPRIRCLQAGIPRSNTPVYYNSYQILQRPGAVIMLYEWNHETRVIPLDGRPHLDPRIRLAMGDSRGHWEGNTLVVDVTNFNDETWVLGNGQIDEGQPAETAVNGKGIVHSPELHVVERYIPMNKDIIHYEALIEDPKAFTRPFTISFDVMVRGRPDHQLFEYACHEGNREGILLHTGIDIDPSQKEQ